jgi:Fe-S cluster assembly ATP-binding protein
MPVVAAPPAVAPIDRYRYCRVHQEDVQAASARLTNAAKPLMVASRRYAPGSEELRAAQQARMAEGEELDASAYYKRLYSKMDLLKIDRKFTSRSVNDGFSGGEKKRCEILQMAMLEPKFALMDETDSGLDIDALRIVADGVNTMRGPNLGVLLITHYQRLLDYIVPDHVHVMYDGRIVKSGDKSLALELEAKGYDWIKKELQAATA